MLKGIGAVSLAVGVTGWTAASAAARSTAPLDYPAFDAAIEREFASMGLVGAAVALVSGDRVLHTHTLGTKDLQSRQPVDRSTHFLVASTTKSMSSLLVAKYVDDGKLDWDQKVIDAYPEFRAPTDELTRSLRVRDLMGMATGIGEPAISGLHQGDPTAPQLLQSIVNLPVIARPGEEFFYNNTVYAVAGYLPAIKDGASGAGLTAAYHELMRTRVFGHAGMTGARLADDPRGIVTDYSRGHGPQLSGNLSTMPYGPVGSYWPVGGTLATLDDMAAYVRLHLRDGVSVDGRRVVSAANLAERYKPQISVPLSPELDPDAVSAGYGMGLIHQRYRDGSSLIWHNGGIDGFTSYVGFLPQHDLGLVVLNSINPEPTGFFFYLYVLNLVLNTLGINHGVPAKVHDAYQGAVRDLRALGHGTRSVDHRAIANWLGNYEGGYRLVFDGREVQIRLGSRILPLRTSPDGHYVISAGLLPGNPVKLDRDTDGVPRIELEGVETVRRTVGLSS